MTALTTNAATTRDTRKDLSKVFVEVVDAEVLYRSAFASVKTLQNATSADVGRAGAYTGAVGELVVGEYLTLQEPQIGSGYSAAPTVEVTGATSAAEPPKAALSLEPRVYRRVAVTGVSSIAHQFRLVYLSDDNVFTLTVGTRPDPVGYVLEWFESTTCDVYFFSASQRLAGIRIERLNLTALAVDMTQQSADLLAGYIMPYAGIILGLGFQAVVALTGSPTSVINAELDTTNVTGGTLALTATAINVMKVSSSFATAGHYFSRGSVLDVEIDGGTAPSAGTAMLFVDVLVLPGT